MIGYAEMVVLLARSDGRRTIRAGVTITRINYSVVCRVDCCPAPGFTAGLSRRYRRRTILIAIRCYHRRLLTPYSIIWEETGYRYVEEDTRHTLATVIRVGVTLLFIWHCRVAITQGRHFVTQRRRLQIPDWLAYVDVMAVIATNTSGTVVIVIESLSGVALNIYDIRHYATIRHGMLRHRRRMNTMNILRAGVSHVVTTSYITARRQLRRRRPRLRRSWLRLR